MRPDTRQRLTASGWIAERGQSDGNGNYAFPGVPACAYSITAALSGFSDASLEGIVVADGLVEAPPMTLSIASFGDTVVVTASRTEVRVVDAPVTTSVVPAATLETTASSNVGNVLRSVPGVNVIQLSARDVQVTSRQCRAARPAGRPGRQAGSAAGPRTGTDLAAGDRPEAA